MRIGKFKTHPAADGYQLLEGAEFDALVADIAANGLREPGVLLGLQIIDGRNRARACEAAGVEMRWEAFAGGDVEAYVRSKNLHRRHLNVSQRALIAAREATLDPGRPVPPDQDENAPAGGITQDKAAQMFGVSRRSVQRARVVLDDGLPEVVAAVEAGRLAVNAAYELAREPEQVQREIVASVRSGEDEPLDVEGLKVELRAQRAKEKVSAAGAQVEAPDPEPAQPAPTSAQGAIGRSHVSTPPPTPREPGEAQEAGSSDGPAPRVRPAAIPDPAGAPEHALNEWDWFGRRLYALAPRTFHETVEAMRLAIAKLEEKAEGLNAGADQEAGR